MGGDGERWKVGLMGWTFRRRAHGSDRGRAKGKKGSVEVARIGRKSARTKVSR